MSEPTSSRKDEHYAALCEQDAAVVPTMVPSENHVLAEAEFPSDLAEIITAWRSLA